MTVIWLAIQVILVHCPSDLYFNFITIKYFQGETKVGRVALYEMQLIKYDVLA